MSIWDGIITKDNSYITKYFGNNTYQAVKISERVKPSMLEPILNSQNKEQVLIFLIARGEGYATEIARFYNTDLFGVQNQLDRLEAGGILVSKKVGRTRVFVFNPGYAFIDELKGLLEKALSFYPEDMKEKLLMNRRRPKMRGKS
jgi:predicted transcriptional regulator